MTPEEGLALLRCEVLPTYGCTEPAAVALAAAWAGEMAGGRVDSLHVRVSPSIYRNARAVGLPGTKLVGVDIAAALGTAGGSVKLGLEVFRSLIPDDFHLAEEMVRGRAVAVEVVRVKDEVYVSVTAKSGKHAGVCTIKGRHDRIVQLSRDGKRVKTPEKSKPEDSSPVPGCAKEILAAAGALPPDLSAYLVSGARINEAAATHGLAAGPGLGTGKSLEKAMCKGQMGQDLLSEAMVLVAAAADARMAGEPVPVMSSAGSGNQGLVATLPVSVAARRLGSDEQALARALAVSHLVTAWAKSFAGRLSALCGCGVAASAGAGAGVAILHGGMAETIDAVVTNVVADLTGMICDGAKPGCAVKLSTAAASGVKAALLALNGVAVPCGNGIIGEELGVTLAHLGRISHPGMTGTSREILHQLVEKQP